MSPKTMELSAFNFIENFAMFCCSIAIPSNMYAAYVVHQVESRIIGDYRFSFYFFFAADILYAIAFLFTIPMFVCNLTTVGFVLIGPVKFLAPTTHLFFVFSYLFSFGMLYLTTVNTLMYRYFHICRPRLFYIIRRYKITLLSMNLIILIILCISLFTFYTPNKRAYDALRERSLLAYGYTLDERYFFSLTFETMFETKPRLTSGIYIALLNTVCISLFTITVRSLCYKLFGNNKIENDENRVTHRYFFYLLLLQMAVPCTLLLAPYFTAHIIVIFNLRFQLWTGSCITVAYAFFPFINSLTLLYVKDYKKFIFHKFVRLFNAYCVYLLLPFGIMINLLLAYVVNKCPKNEGNHYRSFLYSLASINIILTIAFSASVPVYEFRFSTVLHLPVGIIREMPYIGSVIVCYMYAFSFGSSNIAMGSCFIYRYVVICRPDFMSIMSSKTGLLVIALVQTMLLCVYIAIVAIFLHPNEQSEKLLSSRVFEFHHVILKDCYYLTFDKNNMPGLEAYVLALFSSILPLTEAIVTIFLSAKIILTLQKKNKLTSSVRSKSRSFQVLIYQCFIPAFCLGFPLPTCFSLALYDCTVPTWLGCILSAMISVYPIINPISILYFIGDYKKHYYILLAYSLGIILPLGLGCNIYLAFVVLNCTTKTVGSNRVFFLLFVILDTVFILSFCLCTPTYIYNESTIAAVIIGPLRGAGYIICGIAFSFYCLALGTVYVLLGNCFVYRYIIICRPQIYEKLKSKEYVLGITLVNVFFISLWVLCCYFTFFPKPYYARKLDSTSRRLLGVSMYEVFYFALDYKIIFTPIHFLLTSSTIFFIGMEVFLIAYLSTKIVRKLRRTRKTSLKNQWKYFRLLLVQSIVPTIFLHGPLAFAFSISLLELNLPPWVGSFIFGLYAVFPAVNPFAILYFIQEYRNYSRKFTPCFSSTVDSTEIVRINTF